MRRKTKDLGLGSSWCSLTVATYNIEHETSSGMDVIDLTDQVGTYVGQSGVTQGLAVVFTPGSTAGITTIEYEQGVVEDLRQAIERMVPRNIPYLHDQRWGDGNGYSHVRAALLGPSLTVPIVDGRMTLGTWQQIVLLDFDNRPRRRQVVVQVSGD